MGNSQSTSSQNSGFDLNQSLKGGVIPIGGGQYGRLGPLAVTGNSQQIPEKKEEESIQLVDQSNPQNKGPKKRPPI